eukprot:scaffold5466_cov108-Isochrysis_galbana.AAC.11
MHEIKGMQCSSVEQQERVAARLERSQDEIISLSRNQKMAAYSTAPPRTAPPAATILPSPRFSAHSPQIHRRAPVLPSPASSSRPLRSSLGGSGNEDQPVKTSQRIPPLYDARSGGKSIRTPSEASLHLGLRPSSPALSCTPSCTPSLYLRRAAIKQDLFDDDGDDAPMMMRPSSGTLPRSLDSPAAAATPSPMSPPTLSDRIVVPLGAARPAVILGATSLSHSGSKRRCAPLGWQSR